MNLITVQTQNVMQMQETPLTEETVTKEKILEEFKDVFTGLGHMDGAMHLELDPNIQPKVMPPRRVPVAIKDPLKEELQRLEREGIIKKVDKPTDWVSALVVIPKQNGKLRVCIDPLYLNQALKRSHYPLPIIDDVLPELSKAKSSPR